jgi:hypothetical protein
MGLCEHNGGTGERQTGAADGGTLVAPASGHGDIENHHDLTVSPSAMSWALDEFFAAVAEEFDVEIDGSDEGYLETPGEVIDFVVDNTEPSDGMDEEDYRDHVAGVVGEIMARTLGVTRYSEGSRFVQDLRVK